LPLEADHPSIHHVTTLDPVLTILPLNAHLKNHIIVIRKLSWARSATVKLSS
jgi:hypothetical protein